MGVVVQLPRGQKPSLEKALKSLGGLNLALIQQQGTLGVVVQLPFHQQSMLGVNGGFTKSPRACWELWFIHLFLIFFCLFVICGARHAGSCSFGIGGSVVGSAPTPQIPQKKKKSLFLIPFYLPFPPDPFLLSFGVVPGAFWGWGFTHLPLNPTKSSLKTTKSSFKTPKSSLKHKILLKTLKSSFKPPKIVSPSSSSSQSCYFEAALGSFLVHFFAVLKSGVHPLPFKPPKSS